MIISLTFKTPGVVDWIAGGYDLNEEQEEEIKEFLGKWVKYEEYVTIDFDTEVGTATVREVT
jgi:hypothetical protein